MPNPFPGMDPYLEEDLWTSVHTDLCAEIARQLSPRLRPKYVALSTRRVVLAWPEENGNGSARQRFPDVGVLATGATRMPSATALTTTPLILVAALPEPIPHVGIEIRDAKDRRLATCIEVLSPTNKRGTGREEYAAHRLEILSGNAHLLEIDFLRVGTRFPTAEPLPAAPYFVFLSRSGNRGSVTVWPIPLDQPLPEVAVPLLPGDPDVPLNLHQALTTICDIIGYDELIDYRVPPPGQFAPEELAWIEEQLRRAGKRG